MDNGAIPITSQNGVRRLCVKFDIDSAQITIEMCEDFVIDVIKILDIDLNKVSSQHLSRDRVGCCKMFNLMHVAHTKM